MNILVFNCGSSSLKYRLLSMPQGRELAGGEAQRVGPPTAEPSRIIHRRDGRESTRTVPMADHGEAFERVLELLSGDGDLTVDAVAHRMVHGGRRFDRNVVLGAADLADLHEIEPLAPIHNPPAVRLIRACAARYPRLPQVAVFDTAYHSTIPARAGTYALPQAIARELGIRKYGFHGTSHAYVAAEAASFLGKPLEDLNAVSCHLGSGGASLCAIVGGRSIDNTMGYSPLQGLVMSTRCGDLDPSVAMRLLGEQFGDGLAVEKILNTRSGVLGLSAGRSGDIRDALDAGDDGAMGPTSQVYLWRLRKYLGAYLAAMGGADAVIFTDTIGETVPQVRWAACAGMECFGLKIDPRLNASLTKYPADIAAPDSRVRILVILTNEELAIARQAYDLLHDTAREGAA